MFIIDVDVDRALARISSARQGVAKLFEKKDFLEKVRANYLALRGANLVVIDGNPDLQTVMSDGARPLWRALHRSGSPPPRAE